LQQPIWVLGDDPILVQASNHAALQHVGDEGGAIGGDADDNAACESFIATIKTELIRGVPEEKINQIVERLAIKRLGRFEDVANVVDFFASRTSDYVTGQTLYLGGV
jgi:NAD(P)-dependent dehydrogenase (short-subunit alcohol dehydrogenase family)